MLATAWASLCRAAWPRQRHHRLAPVVLHALGEADVPALWALLGAANARAASTLAARFAAPLDVDVAEQRLVGVIERLQRDGATLHRAYLCPAALAATQGYPALPAGLMRLDDTMSIRQQRQQYAPHQHFERMHGTGWLWLAVVLANPVERPVLDTTGPTMPRVAAAVAATHVPDCVAQGNAGSPVATRTHGAALTPPREVARREQGALSTTGDASPTHIAAEHPVYHAGADQNDAAARHAATQETMLAALLERAPNPSPGAQPALAAIPADHSDTTASIAAPGVPSISVTALADADNLFLCGPKGAGKTTLLLQLYRQRSGYHEALDPHNEAGKWPCPVFGGGRRYAVIRQRLLQAMATMTSRYQTLDAGTTTQAALRANRITLVGDEWGGIRRNLPDVRATKEQPGQPGAGTMLKAILTEGRKAAICILAVTHDDTTEQTGLDGAAGLLDCFDWIVYVGGQATGNESIPKAVRAAAAALPRPAVALHTERKAWYTLEIAEEPPAPAGAALAPARLVAPAPTLDAPSTPSPLVSASSLATLTTPTAGHVPRGLDAVRAAATTLHMPLPIQCGVAERTAWLDDAKVRLLLAVAAKHGVKAQPLTPVLFGVSTGALAHAIRERLAHFAERLGAEYSA